MYRKAIHLLAAVLLMIFSAGCETTTESGSRRGAAGPMRAPAKCDSPVYIDAHNHLFGGKGQDDDYAGAARAAVKEMDKLGIRTMIIMPPPQSPGQRLSHDINTLIPAVRRFPDRFALMGGGGVLNVMIHDDRNREEVSPETKRRFEEEALNILAKGAVGFGEFSIEHFSFSHDHPYESVPGDHPLFLLLADIAARHGVPVDIHMEAIPKDMPLPERKILTRSWNNPKMLRGNIASFERLLAHNRDAKIIWAHVGWCNTGYRTPELCRELLARNPNLYMSFKLSPESVPETRPISGETRDIKPEWLGLIRDFPDRFVLGTDQFYGPPGAGRIGHQKTGATKRLMCLLPPDLAQRIGVENPRAIFNLK